MPLQEKTGACGVLYSVFARSSRKFEHPPGGYPVISGWEKIAHPFAHSKRGKSGDCVRPGSNLLPENSGYWPGCSALQGYISNQTFKGRIAYNRRPNFGQRYFRNSSSGQREEQPPGMSFLLLLFVVLGCVANVRMQRCERSLCLSRR